ncbi:hypothetical protein AZSI13_22270 [Azospira sp. I13]|uniref:fused MFS/spermidine synthase n=1 Tax=Azospira sp. I13 TaxID=1765050 RepID=UPI000D4E02AD|nr:fused MFS/spermidine synthase [Azospira sp. I13]GBG02900.1 hypothetical protein AZSI13_22270 [Azospira sp. I13]
MPPPSHDIDVSEEAGVRYLHFGSDWVQGAMRIARPWNLELAYTREMMAGLLLRSPGNWPRNALLIGLGAGSLTKFIYRNLPRTHITVVEINPEVELVARFHFKLPHDPERLDIHIGDGAAFMAEDGGQYDLILVDGFDPDARAGGLDKLPFYRHCRERLTAEGLLSINLLGRSRGFAASAERLSQAFEGRSLVFPSCDSGNAIAFAAVGEPVSVTQAELKERAETIKKETGLNLLPTLTRLQAAGSLAGGNLSL